MVFTETRAAVAVPERIGRESFELLARYLLVSFFLRSYFGFLVTQRYFLCPKVERKLCISIGDILIAPLLIYVVIKKNRPYHHGKVSEASISGSGEHGRFPCAFVEGPIRRPFVPR